MSDNKNINDQSNKFDKELLTEDFITDFVDSLGGLLLNRRKININGYKGYDMKNPIACINGYRRTVEKFYKDCLPKFKEPVLLIIIEFDHVGFNKKDVNDKRIKHILTWNKPFDHPKVTALPIALNFDRQYATLRSWLDKGGKCSGEKLLGLTHYGNTHSLRGKLTEVAKKKWNSFAEVIPRIPLASRKKKKVNIDGSLPIEVPKEEYFTAMSKYKFILAPPGAGEDTHRCWEALYIGCIPIVRPSHLNELYQDLPVLVVNNITGLTKEFLETQYKRIMGEKHNMKKLYLQWWLDKIVELRGENVGEEEIVVEDEKKDEAEKAEVVDEEKEVIIEEVEKVEEVITEEVVNEEKVEEKKKKVIHFATYADHVFANAKKRLLKEAKQFGEFDGIYGFDSTDLPKQFVEGYKPILQQKRGAGYWIWRPVILNKVLKKMKEGEFLVYMDAGSKLNPLGKKRFFEYIDMLDQSEYGTLSIQMSGKRGPGDHLSDRDWTIGRIFKKLEISVDSEEAKSGQLLGGIFIMKKCKQLEEYMERYSSFIFKHPDLCTDMYNKEKQHSGFRENRHEQSVSSLIRKQMGTVIVDADETFMIPFGKGESLAYPFWATRSKS